MKRNKLILLIFVYQLLIIQIGNSQNIGINSFSRFSFLNSSEDVLISSYRDSVKNIEKIPLKTFGQLTITPLLNSSITPSNLVQNLLVSGCLVASNISYNGNLAAIGSFDENGSSFPLNNGIIIATGTVTNAIGPNQFTNTTTQFTTPGDADLNVITGSNSTRDAAVLQFDFVPANNTVEFRYIFASEEYPEWACGTFNDVFAFLLSGPGINGGQGFSNNAQNIALLPNNITPVTINNIHIGGWNQGDNETAHDSLTCPDMNPQFYVSNAGSTTIEYDGMTTILTARWTVIPCQTYHIKFAIADVADRKWDSGVFIEGASFTSNPVSMKNYNQSGNLSDDIVEGCNYNFEFLRNNLNNTDSLTIFYSLSGTSDSLDHTFLNDSIIIPAGANSVSIPYSVISDGIPEGIETLIIAIGNGCPCSSNAILKTLKIYDPLELSTNIIPISCNGSNNGIITANATGGSGSYQYSLNGNAFQSSNIFPNLSPGLYIIEVSDGISCTTETDTILLTEPIELDINTSITSSIHCFNDSTAEISAVSTGGNGGYIYSINGGISQSLGIFNGLSAGIYIISVMDTVGCSAVDTIIINQPTLLNPSITISNDASCNRFFDGSAIVSVSGGTPGYSYIWSNGCVIPSNNYLSADIYFLTVTDNNGCIATDSVIIDEPSLLTSNITSFTDVSCFGSNDGSAMAIGGGGTPPYSYLWSNGASTNSINGLAAGSYIVTVTDDHGCVISATVVISEPPLIIPNINIISQVSCNNGNDGSVNISASGGVPPYSYNWSNGSNQTTLNNLTSGTYSVTITDDTGCTVSTSVVVNQPLLLTASINYTDITCFNQIDGTATASAVGGTAPYTYFWSNGSNSAAITNLPMGTYTVTVTDYNSCTASTSINIVEPAPLTSLVSPTTNVDCFGNNTGSATVIAIGGTSPYSYNWSSGGTNVTSSGLISGTYYVTITDNHGCTDTNSVDITQPLQMTTAITSTTNVSCYSDTNGSATITTNGGTPPYNYNWSNGSNSSTISNLIADTYFVTVTDSNGCSAVNSVTIAQPIILLVNILSQDVACNSGNTGSATAIPSGGTSPYNYEWSTGDSTATIDSLIIGSYSVTVTDINGCSASSLINIIEPLPLTTTISATTDVLCFNGSTGSSTVVPNGGTPPYTYNWSNGIQNPTATGLSIGTYTVTVTDNNGCTSTNTVAINQPLELTSTISANANLLCFGDADGSATISATGGVLPYSYNWSNGLNTTTIDNLTAGTYSVTVTDSNGCTTTNSITINQPNILNANISSLNVACNAANNGSASVTATGGTSPYYYNWSNGSISNSVNNLAIGNYSVTVTDANGCTASNSVIITEPTILNTIINSVSNVSCFGGNNGSANVSVSGGTSPYSYNWSNGSVNNPATGLISGTFNVTITDINGCTATNSVSINQPTLLSSFITTSTNVSCNGGNDGSASATVNGGTAPYSYMWSNGDTTSTINNLIAGNYAVTITDMNGCINTNSVIINQATLLIASITSFTNNLCFGDSTGSAEVTATGGNPPYLFNWSNGVNSAQINNLISGTYAVTATDINGCTASTAIVISEPQAINPIITSTNIFCFGGNTGSAEVNPTGGTPPYSYIWSNGNITSNINNLNAGTYSLTVTDVNGCSGINSVTLTQAPLQINLITNTTDITCFGENNGTASVSVVGNTGPYIYNWSNNANTDTIAGLSQGIYSITVTDNYGCEISDSIIINEPLLLTSNAMVNSNVSCFGGTNGDATVIVNGGTNQYFYAWSNGSNNQNNSGLASGIYFVTITDNNGCSTVDSVVITEPTVITSSISSVNNVSCFGGNNGNATVICSGGVAPYSFNWSNGTNNNLAVNLSAGYYVVTITDNNGCIDTTSVIITEPSILTASASLVSDVSCFSGNDGAVEVIANGGVSPYIYSWSNGAQTATNNNMYAGLYTVTVTDNNGCTANSNISINQPVQSIFVSIVQADILCNGGNNGLAIVIASGTTGPYTYNWSNGAISDTINDLVAGTYTITVTDGVGCTMSSTVSISEPDTLSASITSSNVSCFGGNNGNASLVVSGGTVPYYFLWSNGNTNPAILNLNSGTYSVTITDINGCVTSNSTTITEPSMISSTITATNVSCYGGNNGTASISVNGGIAPYSYHWSNSVYTSTTSGLYAGLHTITVTDDNQCVHYDSILITEPPLLNSQIISFSNASCFGYNNGSATVLASGGIPPYQYEWDIYGDTTPTSNTLGAGQHQVVVTDSNGCVSSSTITISQPTEVIITTYGSTTVCAGNITTVGANASGGTAPYIYTWDPPAGNITSQTILVNDSASYYVFATDSNGCVSDTGVITVNVNPKLTASISGPNHICMGESATLTLQVNGGVGPYTYLWDNNLGTQAGPFIVTPTTTTTYMVTVNDACNSAPAVNFIEINVHDIPVAGLSADKLSGCGSLEVNFTDQNYLENNSYLWDFGDPQSGADNYSTELNPSHLYNLIGVYNVAITVTSEFGCDSTFIYPQLITVHNKPIASFQADKLAVTLESPTIRFSDQSYGAMTWSWDFDDPSSGLYNNETDPNPYHMFSEIGTHNVKLYITNGYGCSDSTSRQIQVYDYYTFYIPNAFTPNGDGLNDEFLLQGTGIREDGFNIIIYDRWGEMVFESNDIFKGWNGYYKGGSKPCSNGIYSWTAIVKDMFGAVHSYTGSVTLIN